MRHGSHGMLGFYASPTTASAKKLNNRARLVVRAGRRGAVSRLLRTIWAVPRQTATRSLGGLDSHPSHRYLTILLADRSGLSAHMVDHVDPFVSCVPDDRDPLHHKVLTVQALLGPFGASRWHGESGTVALSDQPIRLPHFAPRTRQKAILDRVFQAVLAGLSIQGASNSLRFADAVRLNARVPIDTSAGERSESGRLGPSAHDA